MPSSAGSSAVRMKARRRKGGWARPPRLMPTTAATTLRKGREHVVIDGPFAETKEQLLGFYVVECRDLERGALETARELAKANDTGGCLRDPADRAVTTRPPEPAFVTDIAWIDGAITVRPPPGGRGAAALFPRPRYGRRSLSGRLPARAEELAQQRPAARSGRLAHHGRPQRGARRRAASEQADGAAGRGRSSRISRTSRRALAERLDECRLSRRRAAPAVHLLPSRPAGHPADRARAAHRLGPHGEADRRAPSWSAKRDGAADHPRQGASRQGAGVPFETPGRGRSAPSGSAAVAAMVYLVFNEGYSASGDERRGARRAVRTRPSAWRACCCACSQPSPR